MKLMPLETCAQCRYSRLTDESDYVCLGPDGKWRPIANVDAINDNCPLQETIGGSEWSCSACLSDGERPCRLNAACEINAPFRCPIAGYECKWEEQ